MPLDYLASSSPSYRPVKLQCPLKDHLEDSSVMDEGSVKETLISKKSIYDVSLDDEV